uniref:PDEase domain-containing protein n=1 Tax=Ditylenchus dipsaci TaxID=166011 RepID=A0A915DRA4_9BILA
MDQRINIDSKEKRKKIRNAVCGGVEAMKASLYRSSRKRFLNITTFPQFLADENRRMRSTLRATRFEFNGNRLSELEKPLYAVYMFRTLFSGIINFDLDDLVRFILTVRKNYRKVPYHNWTHGWTVAHAMFVFLLRDKEFRPLEKLGLFVAAICHDLDHRAKDATTFEISTSEEYKKVLGLIKYCILATDLALFFPNKAKLNAIIKEGNFDWKNDTHRSLAQAILMTACDLIATAKPWKVQTETVKVIFEEFYEQGDAEKINGREPIPMMDRTKANELPQMQVGKIIIQCRKMEELAEEQKK